MRSLVQSFADKAVGTVEQISVGRIRVRLSQDAPNTTALNAGFPDGFPRINGYLLIPNETGAAIGWITSVGIERLSYKKQMGIRDSDIVELPLAYRVIDLVPLGTLVSSSSLDPKNPVFQVHRGIDVFPSVGDPVFLPTREQLQAIVEGESTTTRRRVLIGQCPTAAGASVYVNPDKLFGRHLAILGNTGSGKSCSVAGLIRWSLDAANDERRRQGRPGLPNARFLVLDPNGEYSRAFADRDNVRVFCVKTRHDGKHEQLKVPAWLWNAEEWAAFTDAAPGVQRPILFQALRLLRSGYDSPDPFLTKALRKTRLDLSYLSQMITNGTYRGETRHKETFAEALINVSKDFHALAQECSHDENLQIALNNVARHASTLEKSARGRPRKNNDGHWHKDFVESQIEEGPISALKKVSSLVESLNNNDTAGEDAPVFFSIDELPTFVESLAAGTSARDMAQFVDYLNLRIRDLVRREGMREVLVTDNAESLKLEDWLRDYLGSDEVPNEQITIVDLSLVPSNATHIIVQVIARVTFEALQWYRRINGKDLPTVIVLEEAHSFVHRDLATEDTPPAGQMCCRTFERIAREGRKFGLGLVLASQRPSELSPTVLSQCNTFILHRIVNDQDQDLVRRLVPDSLGGLLHELPSLPSRRAILLGWAVPAPILVEVRELPECQRPRSPDPAFWDVWTGDPDNGERSVDWRRIAEEWIGTRNSEFTKESDEDEVDGSIPQKAANVESDWDVPF